MDAFLLARLARELEARWGGAHAQGFWQDLHGRLVVRLRRRGETGFLLLAAREPGAGLGTVAQRPPCTPRPTALAAYLRAHASGARLVRAACPPFERVVSLTFAARQGEVSVHLECLGPGGRLLAEGPAGRVAVCWPAPAGEATRAVLGAPYRPPEPPPGRCRPDRLDAAELRDLTERGDPLQRRVLGVSPALAREFARRAASGGAWPAFQALLAEYGTEGPVWESGGQLSVLEPSGPGGAARRHAAGLAAAGAWLEARAAAGGGAEETGAAGGRPRGRARRRSERRVRNIAAQLEGLPDPALLRAQADALGASLATVPSGVPWVEVPDPCGGERPVRVELDPALGPAANRERLYRRARKAERARPLLEERLREARRELQDDGPEERPPQGLPAGGGREQRPYRRYVSSDGWPIWVGRNGRENDRLLGEARAWDLWLHVRDAPGGHVLVRKPGREGPVPERTLREAAGLAALHSRRAGEGQVDVMVLEAGRVRKPKGASPGQVLVAGERTVRVAPGAGHARPADGRKG